MIKPQPQEVRVVGHGISQAGRNVSVTCLSINTNVAVVGSEIFYTSSNSFATQSVQSCSQILFLEVSWFMSHQPDYNWSLQPGVNIICPVWPHTEEKANVLEFKKGQLIVTICVNWSTRPSNISLPVEKNTAHVAASVQLDLFLISHGANYFPN